MRYRLICTIIAIMPSNGLGCTCYGTVAHGRLEQGVQFPKHGTKFAAYSTLGVQLGRTYVHDAVRDVVVAAYRALEQAVSGKTFVYGETGFAQGDRFVHIKLIRLGSGAASALHEGTPLDTAQ